MNPGNSGGPLLDMDQHKVGETVPFTILRDGKKVDIGVTLEPMP